MTKRSIIKECEANQNNMIIILTLCFSEKAKRLFGEEDVVTVEETGSDELGGRVRYSKKIVPAYIYHLEQLDKYRDKIGYIKRFK